MTEQDKQSQLHYEQWLAHQNDALQAQMNYYLTEVQKLRKLRKVRLDKNNLKCTGTNICFTQK